MRLSRLLLAGAVMLGGLGQVHAAPYYITHTGQQANSTLPALIDGEAYTVTLVFDNGGSTAVNQTWTGANLTCTIWTFNNARNVQFAQDLVAAPPASALGSVVTNGSGVLSSVFSEVLEDTAASSFSLAGMLATGSIRWFANEQNGIFYDQSLSVGAASGGVPMTAAQWTNPQPFTGSCIAAVPQTASVPVPSLTAWGVMVISSLLALGAGLTLRRKEKLAS